MEKLRILFILLLPLPYPSAAWTRIEFFANYLKNLNYDVVIAGAFTPKTMRQVGSIEWTGMKIYNLIPIIPVMNIIPQFFNIISPLVIGFFLFLVKRPKLVVISVPSGGNSVNTLGCYVIARLFGSKIITDYRDEWEDFLYNLTRDRLTRAFLRIVKKAMTKCYCDSNIVITVTEPVAASLKTRGINNVKVIPNGADLTVFKPTDRIICRNKIGIPSDDFVLIYSGSLGVYYRLDILLRALKTIVDNYCTNTRLIIVGQGIRLRSVLKLAEDIGLRDKVIYLGNILNREELVTALCASDVGVIPHDSDPISVNRWKNALHVKFLEYLACGLPVIATVFNDSIIGKMIIENDLGLVTEPEDIPSLCEAIKRMKTDVDLRKNVYTRSWPIINQSYDRHKLASEFHGLVLGCFK